MLYPPQSFLAFILLFSVSLGLGIYTLSSYKRDILTFINASMFLLCAGRAALEYRLQVTDSYALVLLIGQYNGIVAHIFYALSWALLYYHVLPFKKSKHHRLINILFGVFVLFLPSLFIIYSIYSFYLWDFSEVRIEGYWMFKSVPGPFLTFHSIYVFILMIGIVTSYLMLYSIVKESENRLKKIFLLFSFYFLLFINILNACGVSHGEWKLVPFAITMLIDSIIISWFISGYRILNDNFKDASDDILNSLSNLVVHTDKEFNIVNTNISFRKQIGTNSKNLIKSLISRGALEVQEKIESLVNENINNSSFQITNRQSDNRHLIAKVSTYKWRAKEIGYSFVFTDVTELKHKEELLNLSNRTKDQLFSIIAHDLRKPALAFRGITKKINYLLEKQDFKSLDKLGDSIEQSALGLHALLDNLLKWALSQKDLIKVKTIPINIKTITNEIIDAFHSITAEKKISINNSEVELDVIINGDPDILSTILRNLIDNAIKYSPINSTIYISTIHTEENISIIIKDEGIGMSEKQIEKLFDPYLNKSTEGTEGEYGNGLGMILVKDLLLKIEATINVNSEVNVGTNITISIPC